MTEKKQWKTTASLPTSARTPTYESANAFITDYAKQGYDMKLVSLKLTKFAEVIF